VADSDDAPPPGYAVVFRAPFINHVGPIFQALENAPGTMLLGLRVAEVHSNTMGFMHGGMIATLADSCMGRMLQYSLNRRGVTLKMTMEYLNTVSQGDFLEAHGRVMGHDETAVWLEVDLKVGAALKARSSGVFRLLRRKPD
jgi:uncharacterized protein (TIGR00369 family)